MNGAIEFRQREIVSADERAHFAALRIEHDHRALHLRHLIEYPRALFRFRIFIEAHVNDVAAIERAGHRRPLRPFELRRQQLDLIFAESRRHAVRVDVHHDGGIKLVDDVRLVAPARIAIRRRIDSFRDDIALRFVKSASMIPVAQSALQRRLGGLLHAQVERRINLQSALVKILHAVARLALDVLPDLFRKICADLRRFFVISAEDDRRVECLLVLIGFDVALDEHAIENEIAAPECVIGMRNRAVIHRQPDHPGDQRRLWDGQIFRMLADVEPRRRFDSVRAVSEVHLIRVQLEDLILREVLFDVDRQEHLVDFAGPALFGSQEDLFRDLLRQRGRIADAQQIFTELARTNPTNLAVVRTYSDFLASQNRPADTRPPRTAAPVSPPPHGPPASARPWR